MAAMLRQQAPEAVLSEQKYASKGQACKVNNEGLRRSWGTAASALGIACGMM